ncbi:putative MFS family arabinose efflux permease [Curtobacterium pusillum]|uniref:MFS family arabinose efflux permease n=1 Tax=Curtobacterium pusillum TaxID=69373 RepID=A0AAW3T3E7_9MICO|nr:MFS transporter [Curtobacterium pusillum]MBA8989574.1 putative MFS family arabinose efflux permease [Curtobacterium pusillum]
MPIAPTPTLPGAAPTRLHGPRVALLVGALIVAVLAFQLNASLLTPAIPAMAVDLHASTGVVSQVQSLFFLSGSVLGMVVSRWSDTIGRRRALLVTMGALLAGTVLTVTASSLPLLLTGRVLQGTSSAAMTIAFLVLSEELTAKQFGVSVGVVTAVNGGLGGLDGYIGGAVTDAFGWRAVFVVILVVAVLGTLSVIAFVPRVRRSAARRMDWLGASVLGAFLVGFSQFVSEVPSRGLADPVTTIWLAVAVVAAVAFVLVERRVEQPLIAVPALRARTAWPVLMCTFLTLSGVFASTNFTLVVLSQDGREGFGLNAAMSGLLFLTPTAIAGLLTAPAAGWIAQRIGWVRSLRLATGAILVISIALAFLALDKWVTFGLLIAMGVFYLGLYQATANGLSVLNAPADAPGSLPGIHGACFGLGAGTGVALVGPAVSAGTPEGYHLALWVSVALTAAAFAAALVLRPTRTLCPPEHAPKEP